MLKFKKSSYYSFLLYLSTILIVVSPSLSTLFHIPRLDTVLTPINSLIFLIWLIQYGLIRGLNKITLAWLCIFLTAYISLLLHFSIEKLYDTLFFSFIGFLIYVIYLYYISINFDISKIQKFIFIIALIIYLGFILEFFFKIQLVIGNEELVILGGAFKGFFFNTNDQAVVVTMMNACISFFYILIPTKRTTKLIGYVLVLFGGWVVFISASRAALAGYLIILLATTFINSKSFMRIMYVILFAFIWHTITDFTLLLPIFDYLEKFTFLERSVTRFRLAIFNIDDDRSVDYRSEIYNKFLDNFHVITLGYGPRDYADFFKQNPLSYNLGYTNPHSFFIELYLAFGILAFLGFAYFLAISVIQIYRSPSINLNQKNFYLITLLLFCWLVWVPSSILRMPLIWLPLFLILLYPKKYLYVKRC